MFVQPETKMLNGSIGDLPSMLPSVVFRGNDPTLLSTRKIILERAGLSVRSSLGSHTFGDDAAVLVLCFTLSVAEKVEAVRRFLIHNHTGRF